MKGTKLGKEYGKDYYIKSKVSNYEDYRAKKFIGLADDLISILKLTKKSIVFDFGCATGGMIFELMNKGITNIIGLDIDKWAIMYGRDVYNLKNLYVRRKIEWVTFDYIFFLDVLEHVPSVKELKKILGKHETRKIVVRIPISIKEGEHYYLDVSKNDPTHLLCHTAKWWDNIFKECGFILDFKLKGKHIYDAKGVLARVYKSEKY